MTGQLREQPDSLALSKSTSRVVAKPAIGHHGDQGSAYAFTLGQVPPSVTLKASPHALKVGGTLTLSGLVKHFSPSDTRVSIWRKVAGKLSLLKNRPIGALGGCRWATKPTKAGTWVFVATYETGGETYKSRPVSVMVH